LAAGDVETGRKAIMQRLAALSKAQDTLSPTNWKSASIRDVIISAMAPHRTGEKRISIDGPRVKLTPQQAVGLSLAIHELATNATKYGALQSSTGRIAIEWSVDGHKFVFTWTETGGPRVAPPERRGFGSKLIEDIVASYFSGEGRILFDVPGIQFKLVGVLDS
jgi:two-component sensor histidine kinase